MTYTLKQIMKIFHIESVEQLNADLGISYSLISRMLETQQPVKDELIGKIFMQYAENLKGVPTETTSRADRLYAEIGKSGYSLSEIADKLNISVNKFTEIMNNDADFTSDDIHRLTEILNIENPLNIFHS